MGTPLTEAPLQITEVLNVGETAVSYRIDDYAFERTNSSQGHGIPVSASDALQQPCMLSDMCEQIVDCRLLRGDSICAPPKLPFDDCIADGHDGDAPRPLAVKKVRRG